MYVVPIKEALKDDSNYTKHLKSPKIYLRGLNNTAAKCTRYVLTRDVHKWPSSVYETGIYVYVSRLHATD